MFRHLLLAALAAFALSACASDRTQLLLPDPSQYQLGPEIAAG
jgi:hypothetical protein